MTNEKSKRQTAMKMIPRLLAGAPRWTVVPFTEAGHRGTQSETGYMNSREFWFTDKEVEINRTQKELKSQARERLTSKNDTEYERSFLQ